MKIHLSHSFEDIISIENLLEAWREFLKGKRNREDVQKFSLRLMDNILSLHAKLNDFSYKHGGYQAFNICDPKLRNIHKASVRDRLLHHAICRKLYPFFDRTFIADSYSCRQEKGIHQAINRFKTISCAVSKNHTKTCWILKCDIRKFFASINHQTLVDILRQYIPDQKIIRLLQEVIGSFETAPGKGLPLGNLTSQLFANIYMNEFDQFVKHKLRMRYYIRYADDFVLLSENREWLEKQIPIVGNFLCERLKLTLHPHKIFIKTLASGLDFLGWTHFPDYRVLRGATRKRMMRRIKLSPTFETLNSYLGLLGHGNAFKLRKEVVKDFLLNRIN